MTIMKESPSLESLTEKRGLILESAKRRINSALDMEKTGGWPGVLKCTRESEVVVSLGEVRKKAIGAI